MKQYIIIMILSMGLTIQSFSQTAGLNYISTTIPTSKILDASTLSANYSNVTIQYFDGLGRPVETVMKAFTPLGKDLVSTTLYDVVGRESQKWLPSPSNNNDGSFININNFQTTQISTYGNVKPYSQTNYEPSPLSRVTGVLGAGSEWYDNKKKDSVIYTVNESNEVKHFHTNNSSLLILDGYYNQATLDKTMYIDADNKLTTEYKDKLGRVIMKRNGTDVDTYYVYNDLGQMCYIIPSLAADVLGSETYTEVPDAVKLYGYVYKYDECGNCIYKKLPGCTPIYMIYDKANRLVLSQDGNQRKRLSGTNMQWTVTKYDIFGRVIFTGLMYRSETDSLNMYKTIRDTYKEDVIIETCISGVYSNNKFTTATPLTVNYYDNYDFISNFLSTIQTKLKYTVNAGYSKAFPESATDISSLNAKGMLTGTLVYLLDGSNNYNVALNYYDDKGRVVQTRSTNRLGGYDVAYSNLDFTGKPVNTNKIHSVPGQIDISELYSYTYDNVGRILMTTYQVNNQTPVLLTDMRNGGYDELGRLKTKKRHNDSDTESFVYNIRNWTTQIKSGTFEENLFYNYVPEGVDIATPCYNGNISYSNWKYNGISKGYEYEYDALNRFTGGYAYINNELQVDYQYSEWLNYDKMGNITYLSRGASDDIMDQLSFAYNGNKISKITDIAGSRNQYNTKEYQDKADETNEMCYDPNGNLVKDLDRDIVTIKYNLLNLPDVVQFKNGNQIRNLYDASGRKLRTEYSTLGTPVVVPVGNIGNPGDPNNCSDFLYGTEYMDNFEYSFSNDCGDYQFDLDKVYNSEGYADLIFNSAPTRYFYYRKDHLGNNREVWQAPPSGGGGAGTTVQRTQYYPSGLPWADGLNSWVQNRKYNGKEFVEAHGYDMYDYGARGYYSAIMRFTSVDPLAEKKPWLSPYNYCSNNPLNRVDPDGKDDYFYTNGMFSHRTKTGSSIYVQTKTGYILPTKLDLNYAENRQTVANIVGHYATELGISFYAKGGAIVGSNPRGTVGLSVDKTYSSEKSPAFTKGYSIFVNKNNNKISSELSNIYNLKSTLIHEKDHKDKEHGIGPITNFEHAEVYYKQISDATFSNTTSSFKSGILGSLTNFLKDAIIKDGMNDHYVVELIEKTNSSILKTGYQITFERYSMAPEAIHINVVKSK